MNKIEIFFDKQLEQINRWLAFAEAKNGALIAADVAGIVGLLEFIDKKTCASTVVVGMLISSLILSLICSLISFYPNMHSRETKGKLTSVPKDCNLLFYGDIAKIENSDVYIRACVSRYFPSVSVELNNVYVKDVADEILTNSNIACDKYTWFVRGLKCNFCGLIAWVVKKILECF